MVVQLAASIPSCEEAFLQPRERVEALIILIETLGLEQMKNQFPFNSLGPLVVFFRFLDSTLCTFCRSTAVVEEFCICMEKTQNYWCLYLASCLV